MKTDKAKAEVIARMIREGAIAHQTTSPEDTAGNILRFLDQAERREIAALGSPFMALTSLIQYARWTIGPESPGHHPTMPSAVAAAEGALRSLSRGLTGQELDPPKGPTISIRGEDDEVQRRVDGARLVRALLAAGFAKDDLRVNPDDVSPGGLATPVSTIEQLLADLIEVQSEVFGLKVGDCPDLFADYDRARQVERLLVKCVNAVRQQILGARPQASYPQIVSDVNRVREYQSRGLEDLGAGEIERLLEIAGRLADRVCEPIPPKAGEEPNVFPSDEQIVNALMEDCERFIRLAHWRTSVKLTPEGSRAEAWKRNEFSAGNSVVVILDLLRLMDKAIRAAGVKTCAVLQPSGVTAVGRLKADGAAYLGLEE